MAKVCVGTGINEGSRPGCGRSETDGATFSHRQYDRDDGRCEDCTAQGQQRRADTGGGPTGAPSKGGKGKGGKGKGQKGKGPTGMLYGPPDQWDQRWSDWREPEPQEYLPPMDPYMHGPNMPPPDAYHYGHPQTPLYTADDMMRMQAAHDQRQEARDQRQHERQMQLAKVLRKRTRSPKRKKSKKTKRAKRSDKGGTSSSSSSSASDSGSGR